jgi:hypothetical protein
VPARAVGKNIFLARQAQDGGAERRVGLHAGMVDVVHELEELVHVDVAREHQAAQRRAVLAVEILLDALGLRLVHVQEAGNISADALVHLREQIGAARIKRVVEIENPGLDLGEGDEIALAMRVDGFGGQRIHAATISACG